MEISSVFSNIAMICLLLLTLTTLSLQRPANKEGKTGKLNEQPNILFILLDDVGWNDVGYHGSEIR